MSTFHIQKLVIKAARQATKATVVKLHSLYAKTNAMINPTNAVKVLPVLDNIDGKIIADKVT